ncbi:MAG: PLP-dependent aminotransferase family protein [Dehalococcoidia bacterium]
MDLPIILPPDGPRGVRLVVALREAILSGQLPPGARLPASRVLAAQLALSRGAVVGAYEELVSEGYCQARVGAGTLVAPLDLAREGRALYHAAAPVSPAGPRLSQWAQRLSVPSRRAASAPPVRYDFRHGVAADQYPAATLAAALRRAALTLQSAPPLGDPAGSPRLRRALAAHLGRSRGLRADPERMIIVSGSQQGLDLAVRLLLDPGDRVCVEDPGYARAHAVFRAAGATLTPVPVDHGGMTTASLPVEGARAAYVTPSHQYPTGAVLAPDRRLALLAWAERHQAWILEDDYDSEFRYGGPPLPCLQGLDRADRCLYLGSVSKPFTRRCALGTSSSRGRWPIAVAAKEALDQATHRSFRRRSRISTKPAKSSATCGGGPRLPRPAGGAAGRLRLPATVRVWPVTGGLHAYIEAPDVAPAALLATAARHGLALADAHDGCLTSAHGARLIVWFSRVALEDIDAGVAALGAALREAAGVMEVTGALSRG